MFGEEISESPRQPSPWRVASTPNSNSPSCLYLTTPISAPGTPESPPAHDIRRQQSLQTLLAAGLENSFESLSLDDGGNQSAQMLSPEEDKDGHIEYKLKLLNCSPLRLAKLSTQLKWRLVNGGGEAIYELGVMDHGAAIGITRGEMAESLETLGRMLGALGGGEIHVVRVVQLGGIINSDSDSDDPQSPSALFPSFTVDPQELPCHSFAQEDIYVLPPSPTDLHLSSPASPPLRLYTAAPVPITIKQMHPERTPEERALLKRSKRDARRARRESEGDPLPPRERRPPAPLLARDERPPLVKVKKLSRSAPTKAGEQLFRPRVRSEDGEVRFVVEAVVLKKSRRRESEEESAVEEDDEAEEEGEGWRFLDFADFTGKEGSRRRS